MKRIDRASATPPTIRTVDVASLKRSKAHETGQFNP
ncbi:hypothetical protein LUPAC07_00055 [Micromonospora noduli]|nr:hypothetical protein LUPAC07_00055 [Micromonospora noduli]